jgi:aerobic carbon-monoxide dehydrogenase medium subunit
VFSLNYVRAKSLKHAAELLAQNPEAKILAGGMTLLPTLKQRLARPSHLVDIAGIGPLRSIKRSKDKLTIGAAVRHYEVATSPAVREAIPALAYLANQIGDPQVRNRGTMGGSLANNDPAADYPAAALALGATIITNRRRIKAADYFQGMFATALEEGEIITRISYPVPKRAAYEKFPHPASGYAMTGVFVAVTGRGVRVAVTGAGPGVFRWTKAERALGKSLAPDSVVTLSVDADGMNEDMHATRAYRANLVNVMTRRAVAKL